MEGISDTHPTIKPLSKSKRVSKEPDKTPFTKDDDFLAMKLVAEAEAEAEAQGKKFKPFSRPFWEKVAEKVSYSCHISVNTKINHSIHNTPPHPG